MNFLAQVNGISGLRDDPVPPFSGQSAGIGFASLLQMLVALAIVIGLIRWLVPKYAKRWSLKSKEPSGSELQVLETAAVGVGTVHLVKVRSKILLLGSSASGVVLLSDLTADDNVFHLPTANSPNESDDDFASVMSRLNKLGSIH